MEPFAVSTEKLHPLQLDAFLDAVMPEDFPTSHGPHDNAIEQRHIIVYGRQGVRISFRNGASQPKVSL
jgi:hypothetical protein